MPKPETITKELLDSAISQLVRAKGMDALTARNIAQHVGCSTQPIYKVYGNLQALRIRAVELVAQYAGEMIFHYDRTPIPFLNTGLGYIHFAGAERVLFRVFTAENYMNSPVFGPLEDVRLYALMEDFLGDAVPGESARRELYLNIMIYTHGLAHMNYAGQLGMDEQAVARRLLKTFDQFAGIENREDIII